MKTANKELTAHRFHVIENKPMRFNYNKTRDATSAERMNKKREEIKLSLVLYPGKNGLKTPERMLHHLALTLHMSPDCFRQRSRQRAITELRFLGAYLLRMHFPYLRLQQIARLFGGQDHSSIINAISRANELIYIGDERFTEKYEIASRSIELWLQKETTNYPLAASA